MTTAYAQLEARFAELNALEGASATLHWDSEVMLPSGSVEVRGEQLAALESVRHEKLTDPALKDLLDEAESARDALNDWQRANLREMRHSYTHSAALPEALVSAFSKATTASEHAWRTARQTDDFESFKPLFAETLSLLRELASIKAETLDCSPYDALLDQYDPGMRLSTIDPLFTELEAFLPPFVQQVIEHQRTQDYTPITQPIPVKTQQAISREFMARFGFDFARGRADVSTHPFCGGVPGDIRLTSRYDEANFVEGLYATFHETGHALYEMGLPEKWRSQPVGRARGMSLHESQSLLTEMQLCIRPAFVRFALGVLREHLPLDEAVWNEINLYRHLTRVKPSLIRVTADEVTYPLHILLRTRLEQALLSGDLPLDDLPAVWDKEMQRRLNITPHSVGSGCLQDTHWPGGAIGYFPTYTLGAMIAAQLMATIESALPDLDEQIAAGELGPVYAWLRERIHAKGSLLSTPDLIQHATGKPLDSSLYIAHLKKRYLS